MQARGIRVLWRGCGRGGLEDGVGGRKERFALRGGGCEKQCREV